MDVFDECAKRPFIREVLDIATRLKPQPDEVDMFLRTFELVYIEMHRGGDMPDGWDRACDWVRKFSEDGCYRLKDLPATIAQYGKAPAFGRFGDAFGVRTGRADVGGFELWL